MSASESRGWFAQRSVSLNREDLFLWVAAHDSHWWRFLFSHLTYVPRQKPFTSEICPNESMSLIPTHRARCVPLTVGSRPPSILRIVQYWIEAKDLLLLAVAAALARRRFPECDRRWRPRAL